MSSLKKWDYYVEEILATGPSYDWTMVPPKCNVSEENDQTDGSASQTKRKIVWPCYDDVKKIQPDAITSLLNVSTCVAQNSKSSYAHEIPISFLWKLLPHRCSVIKRIMIDVRKRALVRLTG